MLQLMMDVLKDFHDETLPDCLGGCGLIINRDSCRYGAARLEVSRFPAGIATATRVFLVLPSCKQQDYCNETEIRLHFPIDFEPNRTRFGSKSI